MPEKAVVTLRSALEKAHSLLFDQAFSPCGNYLAVADNHGYITIFKLSSALMPQSKKDDYQSHYYYKASEHALYSLVTHTDSLICGGNKKLMCYSWSSLISKSPSLNWMWNLPNSSSGLVEVNSIQISDDGETLYAACGDNAVHSWDLSSGQYKSIVGRHDDVVHSLSVQASNLLSASEDGTVKAWDTRAPRNEPQFVLCPSKETSMARPSIGKFLTCIDAQDDLIACGGGPKLSLWSMRTLTSLVTMDTRKSTQHSLMFHDDMLLVGGSGRELSHWYINGELKTTVPVTPSTVYSIARNNNSNTDQVLTVAGSGYMVDVCLNLGYKSFSLEL